MIVLAMTMVNIQSSCFLKQLFCFLINDTESSIISHKKALVEERECHQDYCLPKCPGYRVKSLEKNLQDPSKLTAVLSVQKVSYPIGELQYQALRLESNNASNSKHWKKIESKDFNHVTKRSQTSIENLLCNVTYWPVYEFHLNLTDMGNLSKISWECKGLVR